MDRYLGGEEISSDVLTEDLETAVARATFFPVVPVCSQTGVGCAELLDLAVTGFPSPSEHPSPDVFTPAGAAADAIECDPKGPLVAEIVKTTSDPYVGRLSLVRVFSGTLTADQAVHVSGHFTSFFGAEQGHEDHDEDEKLGALSYPFGRTLVPAEAVVAGDLCAIGRLSRAETGDTLSSCDDARVLRPWSMPEPLLPIAIVASSKADEDKLSQALEPPRRRGPERPGREQRRDPPARHLVHGRGARRRHHGAARRAVLGARRPGAVRGVAARDVLAARPRATAGT